MPYIKSKALVIGKVPLKEHDKALQLLLEDGRRIEAKIRRARDTLSKWGAVTEPFSIAQIEIYDRAGRFTITGIRVEKYFEAKDLATSIAQEFLAEVLIKTTPYGFQEDGIFDVVEKAFDNLENRENLTVCVWYLLETLKLHGYQLGITNCGNCGKEIDCDCHFDISAGTTVCRNCKTAHSIRFPLAAVKAIAELEEYGADAVLEKPMAKGLIELMLRMLHMRFDAHMNTSLHLKSI